MNAQTGFSLGALEQRSALMQELAGELEQAQAAIVASDSNEFQLHTDRQRTLCEAVCALSSPPAPAEVSPDFQQRREILTQKLAKIENRVRQLNRIHAALVRRAQRTLAIFSRALASSALTYVAPQAQTSSTELCSER